MPRIVRDIQNLLDSNADHGNVNADADVPDDEEDVEAVELTYLWDPQLGTVAGGTNYAEE